jgi:hypothetical protein
MRISGHGFTCAFVAAAVAIVFASPAISQEACKGLHRSVEGVVTAVNQSIAMAKADLDVNKGKPPMGSILPTLSPQHSMDTLISAKAKIDELKGQLNDPEVSYASAIAVFSYMQAVVEILLAARFDTIDSFNLTHTNEARNTFAAINGTIVRAEAVAIQGARCYIDAYVPT